VASKREPSEDEEEQTNSAQNLTNKISLSLARNHRTKTALKPNRKKCLALFFWRRKDTSPKRSYLDYFFDFGYPAIVQGLFTKSLR